MTAADLTEESHIRTYLLDIVHHNRPQCEFRAIKLSQNLSQASQGQRRNMTRPAARTSGISHRAHHATCRPDSSPTRRGETIGAEKVATLVRTGGLLPETETKKKIAIDSLQLLRRPRPGRVRPRGQRHYGDARPRTAAGASPRPGQRARRALATLERERGRVSVVVRAGGVDDGAPSGSRRRRGGREATGEP